MEQRRRLDQLARTSERFDLAGLMAAAHHKPSLIEERHEDFRASLRPVRASIADLPDVSRERQLAVIRAAHATNIVTQPLELH